MKYLSKKHLFFIILIIALLFSGCYTLSYVVGGAVSNKSIETIIITPIFEFSDYNVYPADYNKIKIIDNRSNSSYDDRTLTLPTLINNDVEQKIMLSEDFESFFINAFEQEFENNHITKNDYSILNIECYILMFDISKSPYSDEYTNSIRIRLNVMNDNDEIFSKVIQYHENGSNLEDLVNTNLRNTFDALWKNEKFISSLLTIQTVPKITQNVFSGSTILFKGMQNISLDKAEQILINSSVLSSIGKYFNDSTIIDSESKNIAIEELHLRLTGVTESEDEIELKNTDYVFVGSLLSTNDKEFLILKLIKTQDGSVVSSNLVGYERNIDIRVTTDKLLSGFSGN